ncbi:MAG TPA: hypothetical protein VG714_06240 [Acidobacteriaceae bacterium]|nr:hypothetical protein [Acidobacteriaceae bacterium]
MSSEQNLSESPAYQDYAPAQISGPGTNGAAADGAQLVPPGMGQSKSSRRRRRKRKNKLASASSGTEPAALNGMQPVGDVQASGQDYAAPAVTPQQNFQQQPGQGGKRWKKKFRDRDRRNQDNIGNQAGGYSNGNGAIHRDRDTHQPGNNAMGGNKRKNKQRERGPRSFVGPMDHSYRAVNGNFADGPPATIDALSFGGRGSRGYVSESQPIDYSVGRAIPIPEDAPTRIYFFIEDLFFNAKINETARKLGVKVAFVRNEKDAVATLVDAAEGDRPGLIVFDLNNANAKPLTLIPKLKAKLKKSTSIIGFLSHIQGDLKAKAMEVGCDTVMPRSAFSQNLPNLLRRYGTQEEEDDTNYNM